MKKLLLILILVLLVSGCGKICCRIVSKEQPPTFDYVYMDKDVCVTDDYNFRREVDYAVCKVGGELI